MRKFPVAPARTKVQCNYQASLAGLSEPQASWADLTHVYYQMAKRPLPRSFDPLAVPAHPLQRGHSECSYSRSLVAEDRRASFPLPPQVTGIGKYSQPQTLTEFHKAEAGPTRKPCKNTKETQVPQEQLEDARQPQEPKVQADKSFLECLIKNCNQFKKNQERPRKGCAQECGEVEKRKPVVSGHMKPTTDLQSQDRKNQIDLQQPLQVVTRQRASPEKSLSEQEVPCTVQGRKTQPTSAQEESQAGELSAKESESKTYPSINKENQPLWRKLEQLAQDYYRAEDARKQLLRQKQELKYKRWDSVIRGTSITLAERECKQQRRPKKPKVLKTTVSSPLCSTVGVNLQ